MAKSRSKTRKAVRKSGRSKRPTTRRAVASVRAAAPGPRRNLPLKDLRVELDRAVAKLSRRVEVTGEPSARVSQAITVFTRWAADIDEICDDPNNEFCGPTMDPLA